MAGRASARVGPGIADLQSRCRAMVTQGCLRSKCAHETLRILPSILLPILTALVQHALWPIIRPFAWFLFYPSVLMSSWAGGLSGGILATLVSASIVWWAFVPPEHTFAKDEARYLISGFVFLFVGFLISFIQGRLKRTTWQMAKALNDTGIARNRLQRAHDDITNLIEHASDGIFITDSTVHVRQVNAAASRMLGYSDQESARLIGQSFEAFIAAADIGRFWQAKEFLLAGGVQVEEWTLLRKDGSELPVEMSAKIFPDGRWQMFARDITERKAVERRLKRSDRANRALSRCNQALIRAADEEALLTRICNVVVQDAGYPFCWVGQALNDPAKTVKVVAESGQNSKYTDSPGVTWADELLGRGPTGTCIRTKKTVVARDISTTPEMEPWRDHAQMHGYASSIAIPLVTDRDVFGALNIYASEADAFFPDEVRLLTELAEDLAFGITALRTKAEHAKAETELRTLNEELEQRVTARTTELQQAREHEFEIGCRIQQTLLFDHLPSHVPGISVAALTLPTQRIDGDFVVFTEPRGRAFDVIVGDVMGKGVPAALLGAATKSHLLKAIGQLSASSLPDELPKPEHIVMRMHAEIAHQLIELESFVTLCYARVDPLKSIIQLVDCGHTGVIHLHRETGKTDLLRGDNLPLGVREDEIYVQKTFGLERGDLLFLFSDGITEARNSSGDTFGSDRLRECIEAQRQLDPEAMVEASRRAVAAYCGSERLADDATLVAVRVEETGPPIAKAVITIGSNLNQLREAREFIRSFCERLPRGLLSQESVGALELGVNEAASNIMKHAYRGQAHHWIHIEAEAFPGRVAVRLHHRGSPFSPRPVSPPSLDTVRESGLGLYMLSKCVDEVQYYQDEQAGNCICLTRLADQEASQQRETPWKSRPKIYKT